MKERVYILHHVRAGPDGDEANVKLIGVYRTEASAQAAIRRKLAWPGFRDHPDGFHVEACELDRDQWSEGFGEQ